MDNFLGEIRPFTFGFAPKGWALCNGQILSINQNQALYSLLGTSFGGDGKTTFALPDLRSRVPMHVGSSAVGPTGGVEGVALNAAQMPTHAHALAVSSAYSTTSPVGARPAAAPTGRLDYGAATGTLATDSIANTGGGGSHSNLQPYLTLNFCIALTGIYPNRP